MSDFLGNLVNRHVDTASHVKPDLLRPFETARASQISADIQTGFTRLNTDHHFPEQDHAANDRTIGAPKTNDAYWTSFSKSKEKDGFFSQNNLNIEPDLPFRDLNKKPALPGADSPFHVFEQKEENKLNPEQKSTTSFIIPDLKKSHQSDIKKNNKSSEQQHVVVQQLTDYQSDSAGILGKYPSIPGLINPSDSRKTSDHNSTQTSTTPTIKVTIGRIDVRAVTPSVPPPAPTKSGPKPLLSLEDYIKQREIRK
jgi:hypothetical protein